MAVYKPRPEELRYLRVNDGVEGPEHLCNDRKSMGGNNVDQTEPRCLYPLLVRHSDGTPIDWNLQNRLQINEQLLSFNREGDDGNAVNQYLHRLEIYGALRKEAEIDGETLTPYSFRYECAK